MNRIYIIVLIAILFQSCVKNTEQIKEKDFENIIIKLVDTTVTDFRKLIAPSMHDLSSKEAERVFYKKVDSVKKLKFEPLRVVLYDTLYDMNILEQKKNNKINFNNLETTTNKIIKTISKKSNDKYNYILKSSYNEDNALSEIVPKYSFSNIYYSKIDNLYFMTFSVSYNKLNGNTYEVLFKIENEVINIVKINSLSIS
ncbi:hypothetical protein [Aurantibacter sp.]|uniref:hypothetical protein n=1 Tax=Aurantibacter sp. TaxID=2807103 RepID=UPI0035C7ECE5